MASNTSKVVGLALKITVVLLAIGLILRLIGVA